jgi:primosomal protein N' (replication factor Y) (superfamily II helicase)
MNRYQTTNSLFKGMDSNLRGDDNSGKGGHVLRVAFESGVDSEFDYLVSDELWPIEVGQRVEVPFGRSDKLEIGFCVGIDFSHREHRGPQRKKKEFKLKRICRVIDREPLIDTQLMELARWISNYYVCPLGQVLSAMVPAAVKRGAGVKTERFVYLKAEIRIQNSELRNQNSEVRKQKTEFRSQNSEVRSKKQKQIVEYLEGKGAFDSGTAVGLRHLLAEVGCTAVPVKKLAENEIVGIAQKAVLKQLPVIPESMIIKTEKVVLNEDQKKVLAGISEQVESGKFGVTLLYGVTDSGKTEVYIRAIEKVIERGKTAIVLLPEIALTAQTVQRFGSRFERIAVLHSGLTAAQRNAQWQKIKKGEADVVIGARSAVFGPLPNLGLIVVDEEHEPSYKQDTVPRYNGRDVAIKRAQLANAHCLLGSATPSLETLANCQAKKHFKMLRLTKRVMNLAMPEMRLVDLRKTITADRNINLISQPLEEQLNEVLRKKEQAILFLNKRGYSNFIFCPSCQHTLHCRNCDVTLTFHKSKGSSDSETKTIMGKHISSGFAVCHYCLAKTLVPEKCPLCGKSIIMIGLGSQRLEEELGQKFPHAKVARVDSDSMQGEDYYRLLKDFSDGRIDILAGTQMLAKGLHFPNVTLVGIVSADSSLYLPDFRSNERTFQLISQVAGRAGRSEKKGVVFVQTFLADQPAIKFALNGDFDGFVKEELKHRKACNLPPFWRLAVIVMRDMNYERLEAGCQAMRERINEIVAGEKLSVIVRGPVPAIINRIQRFHRMQIIVQSPDAESLTRLFGRLRTYRNIRPAVKVAIDIDPVNLL